MCLTAGSPLGLFLALRKINPARGHGLGTPAAAELQVSIVSHAMLRCQGCNRPAVLLLHHCGASDAPHVLCLQMGGNVTPDGLPLANRLFNVYQPFDPVAYR